MLFLISYSAPQAGRSNNSPITESPSALIIISPISLILMLVFRV